MRAVAPRFFSRLVGVGLQDLIAELCERTGTSNEGPSETSRTRDGVVFFEPSPPRGSRWASATTARGASKNRAATFGGEPQGFVRLTTMVLDRKVLDLVGETRDAYDAMQPGLVASRAALIREALARGLAAVKRGREEHETRHLIEAMPSPIASMSTTISLSRLLAPYERSAKASAIESTPRARPRRRAKRRRARRTRRSRTRSRDPDDGDPSRSEPCHAPCALRRSS